MNFLFLKRIISIKRANTIINEIRTINSKPKIDRELSAINHNNTIQINSTEKYIENRVNNLFNIILADINSWQQYNQLHNKPNAILYQNPYDCKDQILQDLVKNNEKIKLLNYNIQDLIEDEFQLEISDKEFEQFNTLNDIIQYVHRRWEIRQQLLNAHSIDYAYSSYWY